MRGFIDYLGFKDRRKSFFWTKDWTDRAGMFYCDKAIYLEYT